MDNRKLWKQIGLSMSVAQKKPLIASYGVAHVQSTLITLLSTSNSSVKLNDEIVKRIAQELDERKPESGSVIEARRLAFSILQIMIDGREIHMNHEMLSRFIIATTLLATALGYPDEEEKIKFLKDRVQPF